MSEPVTLVVERRADREYASIVRGPLTGRLAEKGRVRPVYMLRLDRLGETERDFWLSKDCAELLAVYRWLRDEGTLPPPNLADPRQKTEGRKGLLVGPDNWWRPKPLPRPPGWDADRDAATRVPWRR